MGRPVSAQGWEAAVVAAVSQFGAEVTPRLWGPGEPEDQLRGPTERLVRCVAEAFGLKAELHGEVRLVDLHARPDYQVNVGRAPVGFIEIKRPGKTADPRIYRREDAEQWQKLKLLPNVLYTLRSAANRGSGLRMGLKPQVDGLRPGENPESA